LVYGVADGEKGQLGVNQDCDAYGRFHGGCNEGDEESLKAEEGHLTVNGFL